MCTHTSTPLCEKIANRHTADPSTPTMLDHIERIVKEAKGSQLSDTFFSSIQDSLAAVAEVMEITPIQALFLALFVNNYDDDRICIGSFAYYLNCEKIQIIHFMNEIDGLERRKLIRCRRERVLKYRIPRKVFECITRNQPFHPEPTSGLSTDQLFGQMRELFNQRRDNELRFVDLYEDLSRLIAENPQLLFVRSVKELNLNDKDFVLLLYFFQNQAYNYNDEVYLAELEHIFSDEQEVDQIKLALLSLTHPLLTHQLIEAVNDSGIMGNSYRLTKKAVDFMSEVPHLLLNSSENDTWIIKHESITVKELYYNQQERTQVDRLVSLLTPEHFTSVHERLSASGFRTGFACLFYGAPGTGKTETVYQLARRTGRDIMSVDISDTKSMWYGESEKKIKAVFNRYRTCVQNSQITPILFFNEADAVIGKRKESRTGDVSQTENAIQNILLQEMENLDGILIATTNLIVNLDRAFERRFLYKIEFTVPSIETRQALWQTMLSGIDSSQARELAQRYLLSGGQIENIARKRAVESIINGHELTFNELCQFCQEEILYKDREVRRPIGF